MNKVLVFILGIWILSSCSSSSDQSSERPTSQTVADSIYRPSYHFSPYKNWMGEPISMVFHNGEYHLFYQYNSDDTDDDSNSWGHAISTDMMRWEEVKSISHFEDFEQGSVVSDFQSTSGLGQNSLIAFVGDGDGVAISYSNDAGNSWEEYSSNPALEIKGTPKVIWVEDSNQWIMTLTQETEVTFFSSEDLINWSQESQLSLDKSASSAHLFAASDSWGLLINSDEGVDVLVGEFDGSVFSPTQEAKSFDLGADNSSGTILSTQDRSVYIGWMNNKTYAEDIPTKSWRSSLTIPRDLSLSANGQIASFPVKEISASLAAKRRGKLELLKSYSANWYSFTTVAASENIAISVLNEGDEKLTLSYDQSSFILDRSASGLTGFHSDFSKVTTTPFNNLSDTVKFDIFIDRSSIEIFINDGELQFSSLVFPKNLYKSVQLKVGNEKRNVPATIYDVEKVIY